MALRGEKKSRSTKINIEKKHRAGVGDSWASTRTDAKDGGKRKQCIRALCASLHDKDM